MENKRNSNFELMRIVSMAFIVLWHIIMHGTVLSNCTNPAIKMILEFIMFLIIIHVNSFVLLSGYFQSKSKFKLSKLLHIFFEVVFYSLLIFIICVKLGIVDNYSIVTIFNNISLSSLNNYWFIKMYLVTYVLSDFINKFINRLTRGEFKSFLILSFILLSVIPFITGYKVVWNDGFTFFNFIYLYMIGAYLRMYPLKETYHFKLMSKNGYMLLLIMSFTSLALINYLINHVALEMNGMSNIFSELSSRVGASYFDYATPFVMIGTILYFEFFKTLDFNNKFINKVATYTFGVYLIHDNELVRNNIYKFIGIDSNIPFGYSIFIKILLALVLIYIVCTIIDFIRECLFKLILKIPFITKIKNWFKNFVSSFNFKINW